MSTAAVATAKTIAAPKPLPQILPTTTTKSQRSRLFHFHFTLHPHPLKNNPCLFASTQAIATDPSHPFYIRTQRRLAAFDHTKLHWTVKAPVELSRKAVVRNWAVRRVKEAFRTELGERGWAKDGGVVFKDEGEKWERTGLKGALCIYLGKEKGIVTAEWEDVRRECGILVKKVEALQQGEGSKQKRTPAGLGSRHGRHGMLGKGANRSTQRKDARTIDTVDAG